MGVSLHYSDVVGVERSGGVGGGGNKGVGAKYKIS